MIICGTCGAENEDGANFCGNCRAYLEWEGQRVVPEPPPPPPAAPEPAAQAAPAQAPPQPSTEKPSTEKPTVAQPAAALVVPVTDSQAKQTPKPVQPAAAAARPRPVTRAKPTQRPAPGDLICGHCGTGNLPTRKFCRQCAADLTDAPVAPPLPWWRRLFTRRSSAPAGTAAAQTASATERESGAPPRHRRPRLGRRLRRPPLLAATGLVFLVFAAWSFRAPLGRVYQSLLDRVEGSHLVAPVSWDESSQARGHSVDLVHDGFANRYWSPATSGGDGRGQWVSARFKSPIRLVSIEIDNGASDALHGFNAEARAERIRIVMARKGSDPVVKYVTLHDEPGQQRIGIAISDVTAVRVTIESANGNAPGRLVAIGELRFYKRS